MKAAIIPEINGTWELGEVPTPRPGPGEVLVRVHASAICFNDVLATANIIPFPSFSPAITGHEPVGEVVEVGAGVTSRLVGDRVGVTWVQAGCGRCEYCRRHLAVSGQTALNCPAPVSTGFTVPGGHAEYLVARAEATILLPDGVSYESAAPMMCSGYTAWCAFRAADPKPGERVAVLGIGGVGHLALQFAAASGFETVAITHSPDKHAVARELGADLVVSDGAELYEAGGADVVLSTGNSYKAASDSLRGLRTDGRLVLASIDSTGFDLAPEPTRPFFTHRHRVIGATHDGLSHLRDALNLVAAGKVRPVVELFDKERVADAVAKVGAGDVRFKAVVRF